MLCVFDSSPALLGFTYQHLLSTTLTPSHPHTLTPSQVHGIIRRASTFNTGRIKHLFTKPELHTGGSECVLCAWLYKMCGYIRTEALSQFSDCVGEYSRCV